MTPAGTVAAMAAGAAVSSALLSPSSAGRLRTVMALPARRPSRELVQLTLVAGSLATLAMLALSAGIPVATAAAGAAAVLPVIVRRRRAARVVDDVRSRVGTVAAAIADELRAGAVLPVAVRAAAPVGGPHLGARLAAAAEAARRGERADLALLAPAAAALDGPASTPACGPRIDALVRPLAAALALADHGAALADLLDSVATAHRDNERVRAVVRAELAAPRATAVLLAVLPLFGVGLGAAAGAHPLRVLLHSALGAGCLGGGLILDACGLAWSIAIAERAIR